MERHCHEHAYLLAKYRTLYQPPEFKMLGVKRNNQCRYWTCTDIQYRSGQCYMHFLESKENPINK